jgi:hypothetical protein
MKNENIKGIIIHKGAIIVNVVIHDTNIYKCDKPLAHKGKCKLELMSGPSLIVKTQEA